MGEPNTPGKAVTNTALVGHLTRLGWSPEQFAGHLNALAGSMRMADRIHPKTPRRWLQAKPPNYQPCLPRQPWPGLVCALLSRRLHESVTLASLGWEISTTTLFVPADDGLDHPWNARGAVASLREVLEAVGMDRRHFVVISGTALTVFAHDWLLDPARVVASIQGRRVDHAVVDDLGRVADARRRLNDSLGGGAVFNAVREDLRLVTEMLDNASYTEEVGRRLHAVAAEFARLAGWLAYDTNREALAQRYFMAGLRAAHTSGDRALGANILGFMSIQAKYTDPRDAVRMSQSALSMTKELSPATEASLQGRLATAAARSGESTLARRAEGQMFELLADVDMAAEPGYMYWWSDAEAYYFAGQSAFALNEPRQAEAHYRRAIASLDPSFARDRASWLLRLAASRVHLGELDGAFRAATESAALTRRLDSRHNISRLAEFRKDAEPFAGAAPVKEFDAKFGDLVRSASV